MGGRCASVKFVKGRSAADARRLCPFQFGRRPRDRQRGFRPISTARWRRGGEGGVCLRSPSAVEGPAERSRGRQRGASRLRSKRCLDFARHQRLAGMSGAGDSRSAFAGRTNRLVVERRARCCFPTLTFGLFFLAVYAVVWGVARENEWRKILLLLASWVFYGAWDWRFVALLIGSALLNWGAAAAIARDEEADGRRKALVTLGVIANLAILGFFKYFDFFLEQLGVRAARRRLRARSAAALDHPAGRRVLLHLPGHVLPRRRVPAAGAAGAAARHHAADVLLPAPRRRADRARVRSAAAVREQRRGSIAAWRRWGCC